MSEARRSETRSPLHELRTKSKKSTGTGAPQAGDTATTRRGRKTRGASRGAKQEGEGVRANSPADESVACRGTDESEPGDARAKGESEETEGGPVAELLENAAAAAVRDRWKELSEALLRKAEAGNLGSFRMLLNLAERRKPRETPVKRPRGLLTRAQRYALEPPWTPGMPSYYDRPEGEGRKQEG